ncbi:MAG: hypothetical protein J6W29_06920 [Neisseriaceae bacterium]|nr:hypothetical protein [Neisseriaceae bacterium]
MKLFRLPESTSRAGKPLLRAVPYNRQLAESVSEGSAWQSPEIIFK